MTHAHHWLENAYAQFHRRENVHKDPLVFLYDYHDHADREIVGLIASGLAYGRVASILAGVRKVLSIMQPSPRRYLQQRTADDIAADFRGFRYRVTGEAEITALLIGLKSLIARHGSIECALAAHLRPDEATVIPAVSRFVQQLVTAAGHPLHHLIPDPCRGSACKRLMLYLRWMVRRDEIDPGGWTAITPAMLVMPLDTHVHRVSRLLKLTRRKQANLKTAEEITAALRTLRPDDPLRYDFAMTRPGILGELQILESIKRRRRSPI